MNHRLPFRFGALFVLGASLLHCAAPSSDPSPAAAESESDEDGADVEKGVEKQAQAAMALPAKCYPKMLRTAPYDHEDQPIGLSMTVRINRACDLGARLVDRKVRVYIRRFEIGGTPGPQVLLKDWTDVGATQYRLDIAWTAGTLADQTTLPPGRYQIYAYSLNASLYNDWVAGDSFARNMSTRSDNTYITLKEAGTWATDEWGTCSVTCGGGTQTRTVGCKDSGGTTLDARMCLAAAPSTSQACNADSCEPSPSEQCAIAGGMWMGTYCDYMWWMHGMPGMP